MKWSKLKQLVEDGFAPSLKGRVHIYSTAYQCSCGRGWFTIDGEEIADLSTMLSGSIYPAVNHEATNTRCAKHPAVPMSDRTPGKIVEPGEFSRFDLHKACWEYIHNIGPDRSLLSNNPLIVALSVLSEKIGTRKLKLMAKNSDLHPLVKKLLEFRLAKESKMPSFSLNSNEAEEIET
ncbi:MAG: hypothetical protein ABL933_12825 [Methyloglobulus sp.]|nr:hypothetical protein [Methyloglobulus sp.]